MYNTMNIAFVTFICLCILSVRTIDGAKIEQYAKLKQYLSNNRKQGVIASNMRRKVMPITTVIPPKTTYSDGESKFPTPTPEHVQNLTPKDSVRTHNLLNAGYLSKHYLDLNPNALDSGYTNYKENNIGISSDAYNRPPYGKSWGEKKSPGLQLEPLYYNPTDPDGGAFNSSLKHYRWFHGKWRPIEENVGEQSAAYLPRGMRSRSIDPFHPMFGFIPHNYPHANELQSNKPFHLGDSMAHQLSNPIPVQVPFPIVNHNIGFSGHDSVYTQTPHSVYAKKYFPGVTPPSNKFGFPSPIVDGNKASRPYWNDAPNSWPFPTYDASPEIRKMPIPPPQEATVVSR